jgi:class 3 adenylate cyclase/tetratricopeptide (TPR) repeat protein
VLVVAAAYCGGMQACPVCGHVNPEGQKFCGECAAPLSAAGEGLRQRKTVTVVFCDVVGSTALAESRDPEAIELLLARYFVRMKGLVERHGGTVEKFIGDAVVAVFGVPVVHEDDALRALRAAVEMLAALPDLGVEARIGVNSGEVVTGGDGKLVTGDAVNVAARLQQVAGSGEILVGAETLALARGAVLVEELAPLELKGKAEPVAAYRLLAVGEAPERSHGSRFVGRAEELAVLRTAWGRVVDGGRCELVTVVGEAGVGKSRLVAEFVAGLEARVVSGRCLSYGEGITYFPVVEVIRQLDAAPVDAAVAAPLASLLGESDAATSADEIAWAFRKLLEDEAPLLVVFDDIQWGEETFLDLVEHVALFSAGAPLLLLCLARPELGERRPRWPVALQLEPLPPPDVEALLPATLPAALRERIAHAAGGNPLFVTEMVAMTADAGEDVVVPATLRALLAARLDQLEAAERGVLERGAVEGELFHRGPLQALTGAQVTSQLGSLVRRELIRPDSGLLPGEDAFRFCHLLIRDAAYDALPKKTRAELHERFAGWLEGHGGALVERDEIVGYHLQQAYRYRSELGAPDSETSPIGERAAGFLAAAGHRAAIRGDYHAVANLLERALALGVHDPHERVRLQVELGLGLYEVGRIAESEELLGRTVEVATALGERGLAARALVHISTQRLDADPAVGGEEMVPVAEDAIETFEALGDTLGLAEAGLMLGSALSRAGRFADSIAATERGLAMAQAAGATGIRRLIVDRLAERICDGPLAAYDAIARLEELRAANRDDRVLEAVIARQLSFALAMAGRFDEARAHLDASTPALDEADLTDLTWAHSRWKVSETLLLVGEAAAAEQDLIAVWQHFRDSRGTASSARAMLAAAWLALLCCDQGRWQEAAGYLAYGQEVDCSPPTRGKGYAYLRLAARARVAAQAGEHTEAVELARKGVELAPSFNSLNGEARAWHALAQVQRAAGNEAEADAAVARALELYERKGNIAAAARLREK